MVAKSHVLELLLLAGPATVSLEPLRADGSHRGFAFGMLGSRLIAEYAVRLLDGLMLAGQPLRVRLANKSL